MEYKRNYNEAFKSHAREELLAALPKALSEYPVFLRYLVENKFTGMELLTWEREELKEEMKGLKVGEQKTVWGWITEIKDYYGQLKEKGKFPFINALWVFVSLKFKPLCP